MSDQNVSNSSPSSRFASPIWSRRSAAAATVRRRPATYRFAVLVPADLSQPRSFAARWGSGSTPKWSEALNRDGCQGWAVW